MEHLCDRCGAKVEDGVAFCPQCNAPQIRVTTPTEELPATPPLTPGTPGEVQPPAQPVPIPSSGSRPRPAPGMLDWRQALPGAALAGVLVAVSWLLPFTSALLLMLAGGGLAVAFYRRREPNAVITPGMGARIGAISGLVGFLAFAVVLAVQLLLLRGGGKFREAMMQVIQQSAARNPDPRAQAIIERLTSPEGMALLITFGMVVFLVAFVLLAAAGGALGARLISGRHMR